MGHTLIAVFDNELRRLIFESGIIANNKIPFRTDCDRESVNRLLPYHVTLFHWAAQQDILYLRKMDKVQFQPCSVKVDSAGIMQGSLYSYVLYLKVSPDRGFEALCSNIEEATGRPVESFLHITISVSRDQEAIQAQYKALNKILKSPIVLPVKSLELYQVWSPVRRIRTFGLPEQEENESEKG